MKESIPVLPKQEFLFENIKEEQCLSIEEESVDSDLQKVWDEAMNEATALLRERGLLRA